MRAENPAAPRGLARNAAAKEWNAEFFRNENPTFQRMYAGARAVGTEPTRRGVPRLGGSTKGQFGLLLSRYFTIKRRDVSGTAIMLAQAPVIGVLLALVFGGQKDAIPYWCIGALQELGRRAGGAAKTGADVLAGMQPTQDHTGAIFFLVVSAVWFGTSNAAREIVSERAVYLRERMVNLGLVNYVMSKYVLLAAFCLVQCTMLLGISFVTLGFNGGPLAFLAELAVMFTTSISAVAIGLMLSTVVTSSEAAMALTPIALIPQVVLGGLIVPSTTTSALIRSLMWVVPARWGFQGAIAQERLAIQDDPSWIVDLHDPKLTAAGDYLSAGRFRCATAQIASDTLTGAWGFGSWEQAWLPHAVLAGMTALTLAALLVVLKRRDRI
jgi:hypothetical protein